MDAIERRSVLALATVYLFRMLGLFLIMPVISVAAGELDGASIALVGLAIGIYGLTQAALQVPMGMLSDRVGRKPVIVAGLLLFALGSLLCAQSDSIYMLLIGRALQGAGAIASTLMALLSDVTREQNRTKAMASVGISIGISFMLSLVLGPWLYDQIGLSGLFYLSLACSLIGIWLILKVVPNVRHHCFRRDTTPNLAALGLVLKNGRLAYLNISVLLLHASLTALFVSIPVQLSEKYGLEMSSHSWLYLVVMGIAFIGMVPLVIMAEAKGRMKSVVAFVIAGLGGAVLCMQWSNSVISFSLALLVYFICFNTLEATLPSLISKASPVGFKGTAMGVFSTHQFVGAFIGGAGGGWMLSRYSDDQLYLIIAVTMLIWSALWLKQAAPKHLTSVAFSLAQMSQQQVTELANALSDIQGVEDMQIFIDEQTAYLKVDKKTLDKEHLQRVAPQVSF